MVGAAYYVGSLAGLAFRLPPATPSLIWPPKRFSPRRCY